MLHAVVAAAFQYVQKAGDVAAGVDVRILRGIAHARLGGQVDHALRAVLGKRLFHGGAIGQVSLDMRVARIVCKTRQSRLLQGDVVVIAEVIQAYHFVAALEQTLRNVRTDKACRTRNQHFHDATP